jgi:TRAP-type transport system periplasmic protein
MSTPSTLVLRRTLCGLGIGLAVMGASGVQAQTRLTMSSWASPSHLLTQKVLGDWAAQVEAASQGRIKFNLLPKPVASPANTFDAVRDGLADVSFILHGAIPGRFVLTSMVEFPQMGASGELNSGVYQQLHDQYLASAGEHRGVKLLTVFTHGPGHIFMSGKRSVQQQADLAGVKLRVGGGAVSELMTALGATPVVRPGSETHDLLAGGVVDGTLVPYETYVSYRLENHVKNVTRVPDGLYTLSFAVIMNERAYNALSPQDRQVIDSLSGVKYARMAGKAWDDADKAGIEAMRKNGVKVVDATPEFVATIREKSRPIEAAWVAEAGKKGVDGAMVLAKFREETRRLASGK